MTLKSMGQRFLITAQPLDYKLPVKYIGIFPVKSEAEHLASKLNTPDHDYIVVAVPDSPYLASKDLGSALACNGTRTLTPEQTERRIASVRKTLKL